MEFADNFFILTTLLPFSMMQDDEVEVDEDSEAIEDDKENGELAFNMKSRDFSLDSLQMDMEGEEGLLDIYQGSSIQCCLCPFKYSSSIKISS